MTTPFAKDQAAGLRRMLGQVASRRVLVIGAEEQIDDFVDNLRIALSAMGRDAAVVSAQTMLAVAGMLEQHDDSADVTLVAAHFGSRALGTVAEACDDVLLVFSDGPEGIKSAYTLLKKTAGLQGGAGIRTVVCGAHSVDSAVRVFGNLANTVGQYLNTRIDFAGYLPEDRHVELALSLGKPVASAFPASPSAMAFRQLAEEMLSWASAEAQAADDNEPSRVMVSAQESTQTAAHESAQTTSILTPRATARAAEMVY
ncbi:MinD/ParA family protein [Ralstonia insidiosa]|jgi:flagellar biosynthesis protein FlhG|uniref:MinD/ParA family ATP-binding protein n=1 Tax=Ralstonia TaxID=48736 RepID=UPI000664A895|nr:flagellar synthesis regulator FleN [Ralstonia insidiosa]KMW46707.1 flagellar synthesis regulator FleN [Ralstonia sp. MD27]MBX3771318.1 MinD/ParA family protein [Ralstonia pickettii]NOZ14511.1 MinD/ParA family protein [Betaproteobacteria bacterium]MBA9855435.1 MinD/ParA family protein [Ralstonia insidiosa]MBA9869328.1 MinD/ParA family protein [Ralstonia insidiosa]